MPVHTLDYTTAHSSKCCEMCFCCRHLAEMLVQMVENALVLGFLTKTKQEPLKRQRLQFFFLFYNMFLMNVLKLIYGPFYKIGSKSKLKTF